MAPRPAHRVLAVSCVCALAALALMTWQLFDPVVVPVIVAMSAGQVLGTASFAAYIFVVVADFRVRLRMGRGDQASGARASGARVGGEGTRRDGAGDDGADDPRRAR